MWKYEEAPYDTDNDGKVDLAAEATCAGSVALAHSVAGRGAHHGSIHVAYPAPGAAIQTQILSPIAHASPIEFPSACSMFSDPSCPL